MIKIEKMAKAQASGDWHDRPLRWSVTGPANEVQKFPTWKEARKYAVIRRAAKDQREAFHRYASYVEV